MSRATQQFIPAWGKTVKKAYLLDRRKNLKFSQSSDDLTVQVPARALDPIATVIVLETLN